MNVQTQANILAIILISSMIAFFSYLIYKQSKFDKNSREICKTHVTYVDSEGYVKSCSNLR